ncbi:hypothetical protein [Halorussus caseinilyticus]|uniref:hypothetical protein n=1 Tax=Halorussus caseinilyticus TaxID=3034025 RepID=UPI0023E77DFB|nr:hypothetical protein [Halorussus sp. DT72]
METLGDIVARDRRSDDPAVVAPRERRRYDYHRFCTTAWKTGNFFRRIGVHDDAVVAVADDPEPEALLALFGAALLGAGTRFVPRSDADAADARVVVAPGESVGDYDLSAGGQRVCYGGPPDDPSVHHFERDVWSENPSFPRTAIDPESVALVAVGDGDERDSVRGNGDAPGLSHADLLASARRVADNWGLEPDDEVAVRASLAAPGTVVAGVLAPLLAGAAVLLPDDEATGDFAVASDDAPEAESAVVRPADVRLD